jgi:DNA-directed RNA polymerase specialized sigma24 family protein
MSRRGETIPNIEDRDRKIVAARRLGYSYQAIGDHVGMSAAGVMKALRRIEDGRPGRAPRDR